MPHFRSLAPVRGSSAAVVSLCYLTACGDATAPAIPATLTLSAMQPGEVQSVGFSRLGSMGFTIPATASAGSAEYLMVVANVAANTGQVSHYTIDGAVQLAGTASLGTQNRPGLPAGFGQAQVPAGMRLETTLRAYEREHLTPAAWGGGGGVSQLGARLGGARRQVTRGAALAPADTQVGTQLTLHTLTAAGFGGATTNLCDSYNSATGTVRAVSQHAIVVTDNAAPFGGFTTAELQDIAQGFDNLIYPTDTSYFGTPTDIDGNGRIIIFYTPSVNQLTPAGQAATSGYIGGFFFAGDLFPPSQCAESNQREIFYLLTPDPFGIFGNRFATDSVKNVTRGTVAHEFQHMINVGNRILTHAPSFEATWLDEALAHFAEDVVGRAALGVSPSETVTLNTLAAAPDSDLQSFFLQNLVRAKYYVTEPDTVGPIVNRQRATRDLAARGAEWSLLRYVADQFSHGDAHSFTKQLVVGPDTGRVNLTKRAGAPLDSILGAWLVTLYTDHQGIPGLPATFNYTSYTLRNLISTLSVALPSGNQYLPVNSLEAGTMSFTVGIPASSAAYFLITQSAGAPRSIDITTTSGAARNYPDGRVYLVRLQ